MEILYKNFDVSHIPDNEAHYFELLASVVENVDDSGYFVIDKGPAFYTCRISTTQHVVNPLIKQINIFNTSYGLRVEYSKSIKTGNIFFKIPIN